MGVSVRRIAGKSKSWPETSVFVSQFPSLSLAWPEDKVVLDITRGTGEGRVATAIMVGLVIILAGEVITMVADLITMAATTLADLTMGAQATTLEVVEVVLITTGTMVGQGTTLAATATMEVVGLITTGTTMEVLDTTPADLMTMATTAMVGAVTTQVATGQVVMAGGATLDLRLTGRWWVRLLELLQLWWWLFS